MLGVQPGQQVELSPLVFAGDLLRPLKIEDRAALSAEQRSLVCGGQEPGAPVQWPAFDPLRPPEQDEARQVAVLAAQAIRDPSPGSWQANSGDARVHLVQ